MQETMLMEREKEFELAFAPTPEAPAHSSETKSE
jgi:hypothetical protein